MRGQGASAGATSGNFTGAKAAIWDDRRHRLLGSFSAFPAPEAKREPRTPKTPKYLTKRRGPEADNNR
ncbi:hypothetical protein OFM36_32895, partial [Escherichia coli]|nr:hypothetical protein [Escherichia coli]